MIKHFHFTLFCSLIFAIFSSLAHAGGDEIYTDFFSDKAVSGYDTVAYFTEGKPVKGSKKHTLEYKETTWFFSSAENKALFEKNPEKYAPQYGGHCAWAVGENSARAKGDPKHWNIVDGKLYLNYNNTVKDKWLKDVPGFIKSGDANWIEMLR